LGAVFSTYVMKVVIAQRLSFHAIAIAPFGGMPVDRWAQASGKLNSSVSLCRARATLWRRLNDQ